MFPINPRKIKESIKDFFDESKRIKKKLRLKTETIQRECEMYSTQTGKKHKIQFRFTVTGIQVEDGTFQFGSGDRNDDSFHNHLSREEWKKLNDNPQPVLQAIDNVCEEIRKNLKIPEHKKQE